jgi:transposase-like protein
MAPPKKCFDELLERATRMVVEARRDPAAAIGAIKRIAEQFGIHPEALRSWAKRAEIDAATGHAPPRAMRSGSRTRCWDTSLRRVLMTRSQCAFILGA